MKTNSLEYLESLNPWGTPPPGVKRKYWHQLAQQRNWYDSDGDWLEFGVFTGNSASAFMAHMPRKSKLYMFDCWRGLPEDWTYGPDKKIHTHAKNFDLDGKPPVKRFEKYGDRAVFVNGLFEDTLPKWKESHSDTKVSFIHLDADIYSSTKYVLDNIDDMITSRTLVQLDDYHPNIPANAEHVFKAFHEYIDEKGYDFKYLARTPKMTQVALKIIK